MGILELIKQALMAFNTLANGVSEFMAWQKQMHINQIKAELHEIRQLAEKKFESKDYDDLAKKLSDITNRITR